MFVFPLFQNSVSFGFARSPFGAIWGPWCILFDILGPFWHLGITLESHCGTSRAPWKVILASRDHPGGPWEQQTGHEVANDTFLLILQWFPDLFMADFHVQNLETNVLCLSLFLYHIFSDFWLELSTSAIAKSLFSHWRYCKNLFFMEIVFVNSGLEF